MDKLNDTQIQELKAKHGGEIFEITGDDDDGKTMTFYIKKPDRSLISRFTKELMQDTMRAMNNLVFGCLVSPAEHLKKIVDDRPAMIVPLANEVQKVIGFNQNFLSHKL